jgi:hypothetical protein
MPARRPDLRPGVRSTVVPPVGGHEFLAPASRLTDSVARASSPCMGRMPMLLLQQVTAPGVLQLRVSPFVSQVRVATKRLDCRRLLGLTEASRRTGPANRSGVSASTMDIPGPYTEAVACRVPDSYNMLTEPVHFSSTSLPSATSAFPYQEGPDGQRKWSRCGHSV